MFFLRKIKLTTWLFLGGVLLLLASPQKAEAFFRMTVSPATINAGDTTTLTLHVSSDIVLCLRGSDDGTWEGNYTPISSGDTFVLRPVRTMRYRVKCKDVNGYWVDNHRLEEIKVTVNGGLAIPPTITFSPNPIQSGNQGTLTLSLDTLIAYQSGFTDCRFSNGGTVFDGRGAPMSWSGLSLVDYDNSFFPPIPARNVYTFSARPTDTLTWSIDCLDVGTGERTGVISEVWTVISPTVSLFAMPSSITPGGQSTLYWDSTNATSCTASSTDNSWTGPVATSGNISVSPLVSIAYSIFCTSANNVDSPVATSTITVSGDVPTITMSLSPSLINAGDPTTVTWNVTNATSCTGTSSDGFWSGGSISNTGDSKIFFPSTTTSYNVQCASSSGGTASQEREVTVASASCNNGSVEPGEECDNGSDNGTCPATCSLSCRNNACSGGGGPTTCTDALSTCGPPCSSTQVRTGFCGGTNECCKPFVETVASSSTEITNPIGFSKVEDSLDSILGSLQAIITIISIIFIVIGGILYTTAAGDEGRVKTAKGAITAAMVGLAIGVAAPSFLKQIGAILGWGPIPSATTGKPFLEIATNVLNFLLSITGIVGIIMLVIGGIMYMTGAGDEGRIETGKKIVQYSIIGIAISLGALVLVTQLARFFG